MGLPYRDAPVAEAVEPIPNFRSPAPRGIAAVGPILAFFAPAMWLLVGENDEALLASQLLLPWFVLAVATSVLERPVRAWLTRRRARLIAEGVAEFEAKVTAAK